MTILSIIPTEKNNWKSEEKSKLFKEQRIQIAQKINQERAMNMVLLSKALLAQVIAKVPQNMKN